MPATENWRTSYVTSHGYRRIRVGLDHPMADSKGESYEHRVVAATKLGRALKPGEVVHHRDGNKLNNHPDNLEVCASSGEHLREYHTSLVTDAELRELILVCGYRFRELKERGIKSTHRIQAMFYALGDEGYDLSPRHCPNGHPYPADLPKSSHGKTRCRVCIKAAQARKAARAQARQQAHAKTVCACGCRTAIPSVDAKGRPRLYAWGHNGRRYAKEAA